MNLVDILKSAQARELTDEDGDPIELNLLPGLDEEAIRQFESSLPCALPEELFELLRYCRGFYDVVVDQLDFTGQEITFESESFFPHGVPIASDGYGNFWVVDLSPESTEFGPNWFACHDAPVILYQSRNLSEFLTELFKMCEPPYQSLIDDVHEDRIREVWRTNPDVLSHQACLESSDPILREFAKTLEPSFEIIDLRSAKPGDGFSWGRYGPYTEVSRYANYPIFTYQRKRGWLSKLFGK